MSPLGYRIVAAGTEWVTPPDSAEGEPATAQRTMTLERFDGVGRATRIITARRGKQGTERYLVRAHDQNEQCSHQESLDPESAGVPGEVGREGLVACQASTCARTRSMSALSAEKGA